MWATLFRACRSSLEAMHHCEFTPVPTSELTPRIFFVFFSLLAFFFIRRNKSDTGGEPIVSVQPVARYDYVMKMLGVDVADQRLGAHAHVHKPMTYFWRRVFDQKLAQAISNAYLLYAKWAEVLLTQCKGVLVKRGVSNSGGAASESGCESFRAGPGGAVTNGEDLSVEELTDMCTLLKKMLAMERTVWDLSLIHI